MVKKLRAALILLAYVGIAAAIMMIIYNNGIYPSGTDTLGYLYKSDVLYREISGRNFYPLFDKMWYNGVEMMRYQAPLPLYFLVLCQFLSGGDLFNGYILFTGAVFFLGAAAWLRIGCTHKRFWLGTFLGIFWFFLPNNLYALFGEGDLPRAFCMVLLPLFISGIYDYLLEGKWSNLPKIMLCFLMIILCGVTYAVMIVAVVVIFVVMFKLMHRQRGRVIPMLGATMLPFMLAGIWLYPYFRGISVAQNGTQTMQRFFQSILVTLNPLYRVLHSRESFYFGLAAFLLAIFGILFSYRKSMPGFWTGIIICFCTTLTMYPVLAFLPGSQYLWLLRYISIALCMILYSFLLWDTLKKGYVAVVCVLLCLDSLLSLGFVYGNADGEPVQERIAAYEEEMLLKEAKEMTKQRMALLDISSSGASAAYMISGYEKGVPATFGFGWQAASTARNITQLDQAMDEGGYLYLFDRCLELGNDTILVKVDLLHNGKEDINELDNCAARLGYEMADYNEEYRLYHLDTYESFGTVSKYRAIGIGTSAPQISIYFPAVKETTSTNLNDYTFEELKDYDVMYLAGFTYEDREAAEELVLKLSEAGTKIIILADGIPADKQSGVRTFLGTGSYNIEFSNGYPELDTIEGYLNCDLFPSGYTKWNTVYINGLDECWGKLTDLNQEVEFYGTVKNDNIIMIGLNLTYHYALTHDAAVGELLSHALTLTSSEIPERTIVPLSVEYEANQITVSSEYDNVNTALAWHDTFSSGQEFSEENKLVFVNKGDTVLRMEYPYLLEGAVLSGSGILLSAVFFIVTGTAPARRKKKEAKKEAERKAEEKRKKKKEAEEKTEETASGRTISISNIRRNINEFDFDIDENDEEEDFDLDMGDYDDFDI